MNELLYPAGPVNVYAEKLQPSAGFRKQAIKVISAIVLFLITYLVLLAASVAFAVLCCFAGYWLVTEIPKVITIIAGLGLIVLGGSVIFFMVKFVFAVSKDENDSRVEITEAEQPRLFAFIRQLTNETNTRFPRKIYLSSDVNACVFYHSSFWSMFLPIPKNLEIGLGLVNSINISEFKAVMAHEFGHFSQRSMKLGSFTYNANRIIHNMLYDNSGYSSFIQGWAEIHGILALLAIVAYKIAQGIQMVLRGVYKLINLSYMGLSREMEFHADTIAASVAGGNNLVSSLSRIEIASGCMGSSLNYASERLKENKVASNLFHNQLTIFRSIANRHSLPLSQGLPAVTYQFVSSFSSSRINFKDQWASHPSLEERKAHLDRVAMDASPDETSAWAIFDNVTALQEQFTQKLYRSVKLGNDVELYNGEEFDSWYKERHDNYKLPVAYKGFYDERYPAVEDWDLDVLKNMPCSITDTDALFTEEHAGLHNLIKKYRKDIETVKAIKAKEIDVSSFDFDGKKHGRKDCDEVIAILEADIKAAEDKLQQLDKAVFAFFYNNAVDKDVVIEKYRSFLAIHQRTNAYMEMMKRIVEITYPFYHGALSLEEAISAVDKLKNGEEPVFRGFLRDFINDGTITEGAIGDLLKRSKEFLDSNYAYFVHNAFVDEELNGFSTLRFDVLDHLQELRFSVYKGMLVEQLAQYKQPALV
jgi:Zn-dependent protease with chaperone function